MTILLLSLVVVFLMIGEICGIFERTDYLSPRFYVASGVVAALLVVWLIAEYSIGQPIIPEAFYPSYWDGVKIVMEKCMQSC